MKSSDIFLAVECGASNTVSAIYDSKGNVLGMGFSGPSSHHAVKIEVAKANLLKSVKDAFDSAKLTGYVLESGCFGMAALDTKKDFDIISKLLSELNFVKRHIIVGDHVTAYYTVTFGRPGIVVISGTGSIAYGVNNRGEAARAGGWEWLVSDGGSAYFIAREGLTMAVKSYDNIGEKTVLLKLFMESLNAKDFDDFIQKIYENTEKTRVASLAPVVVKACIMGDSVARDILRRAGEELSLLAVSVARKLGMDNSKVIIGCVGGVFKSGLIVWRYFRHYVKSFLPYAIVKKPNPTTIEGAIFLCLKENGLKLTKNVVYNVKYGVKKFYSLRQL
ncbi:MAG: hypothetical protein N3F64_00255 [Nitrososphaeria archaeon]|nr:hypothetical protein [Nitrososphaeria archaeon]